MHTRPRRAGLAVVATALLLTAAACGNDNADSATETDATANTEVSGRVTVSGSSTVEPISTAVAEAFTAQNSDVAITVDGPGTGDGFALFCQGETDISDASRPIKDEEAAACAEAGVEFIELEVAIDGISVITAPDNPLECLTFADLYALIGPEGEGVATWSGAAEVASALGSDTDLPDEDLVITAPGEESGTYDSFIEIALKDPAEARVESGDLAEEAAETTRTDYAAQPDDNAIIEGVGSEPGGLGWVGFAFADQAEGVKKMPIAAEPGDDCVEPTHETIQDGSYPLSRSLYIYVNAEAAAEDGAVAAYVDFYLEGLTDFVEGADYVALADASATQARWDERTVGSAAG